MAKHDNAGLGGMWFRHRLGLASWARIGGEWRLCVYTRGFSARRAYAWRDLGEVVELIADEVWTGEAGPPDGYVRFADAWAGMRCAAAQMAAIVALAGLGLELVRPFRYAPWL